MCGIVQEAMAAAVALPVSTERCAAGNSEPRLGLGAVDASVSAMRMYVERVRARANSGRPSPPGPGRGPGRRSLMGALPHSGWQATHRQRTASSSTKKSLTSRLSASH